MFQTPKRPFHSRPTSLLSKTLRLFAYCVAVCFLLTAPIFYFLTKYYYAEDILDIIEAVNDHKALPPLDLEQDIIAGMMLQYLLIFVVITIALFITLRFATKKLWEPFDHTLLKAEQFNLAQDNIPSFEPSGIKEFERLNRSFEQLIQKDKETYRIQKEFTENASHELQTPLAIIRSKLDLMMQENLGEREMQLVSDMYELTIRMGHMNRNLLLLDKIENDQYDTTQTVDIVSVLKESLPLYETLAGDLHVKLSDDRIHKEHHATIKANNVLLECMLKNLIVNAIRNAPANSDIKISIADKMLSISNAASGDKPLDIHKLFRRFNQVHAEQSDNLSLPRNKGGNGLGLAIVKAICDFHHWQIEYAFEGGRHSFTIRF